MKTSEKQAARTGALPVLTPVMAPEPEGPLEVVGEADTPTLTNEKRSLRGIRWRKEERGRERTGKSLQCGRRDLVARTRYRSCHPDL